MAGDRELNWKIFDAIPKMDKLLGDKVRQKLVSKVGVSNSIGAIDRSEIVYTQAAKTLRVCRKTWRV